jgi:hypothetical protein
MGYTNHWDIEPSFLKQKPFKFDPQMLTIMKHVVAFYNKQQTDEKMQLKSRLTAKRIQLYGEPATYESFDIILDKNPRLGRIGIDSFSFCKTAREPYDRVVKVFLNLLKYFKVIKSWRHEDNCRCAEYKNAVAFAKQVYTTDEFNRYWKQKA